MAYRNTKKMAPGQTVTGGGWSGRNESAETMRHSIQHVDEELHEPYVNYGSCRGIEWRERPVVYDDFVTIRRRGRR